MKSDRSEIGQGKEDAHSGKLTMLDRVDRTCRINGNRNPGSDEQFDDGKHAIQHRFGRNRLGDDAFGIRLITDQPML